MSTKYLQDISNYKNQKINQFKKIFSPKNLDLFSEDYAIFPKTIKMDELAIRDNYLFKQLGLMVGKLLKSELRIGQGPFSCFLNVQESFQSPDQRDPEVTYFIKPRTKQAKGISMHRLVNIWNTLRKLQRQQIFVLNLSLQNFTENDGLIFNLKNLIILKFEFEVKKQNQDDTPPYKWPKEMISNSLNIKNKDTFCQFIKKNLDQNFSKRQYDIYSFYHIHRLEFKKFVKLFIESKQKQQKTQMNKRLLKHLNEIIQVELLCYNKDDIQFVNKQMINLLNLCRQVVNTQVISSSFRRYYQYPLSTSFNEYTEEQKSMLVYNCNQLLDIDMINVDLLEESFRCIFHPRDFFYLQSDVNALYQKELLQQQALLSFQQSISTQTKEQLANIIKSSNQEMKAIWNEAKLQSCKFNITTLESTYQGDSLQSLYRRYRQYKDYIGIGQVQLCEIHNNMALEYICDCTITNSRKQGLCYFCLQSKHMGHNARCLEHNETIRHRFYRQSEEGRIQQCFDCQTCKRIAGNQTFQYKRICPLHRLPIDYFCLSLECDSKDQPKNQLCFQCTKGHQSHKDSFYRINKQDKQNNTCDWRNMFHQHHDLKRILAKQKFFKFYEIYAEKIKPIQYFLNQLQNDDKTSLDSYIANLIDIVPDNQGYNDMILRLKIRNRLQSFRKRQMKEINEYFSDQTSTLTQKLFLNIGKEVQALVRRAQQMILDDDLVETAQDYLNKKYETVINIRTAKKEEIMSPCCLNQRDIPDYNYARIKKVVIDEITEKESEFRLLNGGYTGNNEDQAYCKAIKQSWQKFYSSPAYNQYLTLHNQVKQRSRRSVLFDKKLVNKQIKQLNNLLHKTRDLVKIQQYTTKIEQLEQYENDGHYLSCKISQIEQMVQEQVQQLYLQTQNPTLHQISFIAKLPNLQHYELKIYQTWNLYQNITSKQINNFFKSSNLNYFYFGYQIDSQQITQLLSHIPPQNFNKIISFSIQQNQADCLCTQLTSSNLLVQQISRLSKHFYLGVLNIEMETKKLDGNCPPLNTLINICENIDKFGIIIKFDQMNEGSTSNTQMVLNQNQQLFLTNLFIFLSVKNKMLVLDISGLVFNQLSNDLFGEVLQSNYHLQQLSLDQCWDVRQDVLENLNKELEVLSLISTVFASNNLTFNGNFLKATTKLKTLALNNIQLDVNFFLIRNLKLEETLVNLTLDSIKLGYMYNLSKRVSQCQFFRQLLQVFKNCPLHRFQVSHRQLNPYDLLILKTKEMVNLEVRGSQRLTSDWLKEINRKWPNLESINASDFTTIKHTAEAWLSFKKVTDITVSNIDITEKQLKLIRMKGKNIRGTI